MVQGETFETLKKKDNEHLGELNGYNLINWEYFGGKQSRIWKGSGEKEGAKFLAENAGSMEKPLAGVRQSKVNTGLETEELKCL